MDKVKDVVSNLTQMLDRGQKEAESLAGIMDELQSYLGRSRTLLSAEALTGC